MSRAAEVKYDDGMERAQDLAQPEHLEASGMSVAVTDRGFPWQGGRLWSLEKVHYGGR